MCSAVAWPQLLPIYIYKYIIIFNNIKKSNNNHHSNNNVMKKDITKIESNKTPDRCMIHEITAHHPLTNTQPVPEQ